MIGKITSILKSFHASWRLCSFRQAFKMPVRVSGNTILKSLAGQLVVESHAHPALRIGFDKVRIFDEKTSRPVLDIAGKVILKGRANFGQGAKIIVGPQGVLIIGDNFNNTAESSIICQSQITIGKDVLVSWDTLIMDTDFHSIIDVKTREMGAVSAPISIGDHVWIGARSVVLKRSAIPDGAVVGANSLVNKKFEEENTLLAGNPAKVVKSNITRNNGRNNNPQLQ